MGLKTKNSSLKFMNVNITQERVIFIMDQYQKKKLKKLSLPLHGNKLISFDTIEILSRKNIKRINIKKINKFT